MISPSSPTSKESSAAGGRDLRLDVFRGLANWTIFVDHVPNNVVAWLTMKNYGFSDAADLFVFISGYTATFVYSRYMRTKGFVAAVALLLGRVWQIYVAYILLFLAYVVAIGYLAQSQGHSHLLDEFNVRYLIHDPIETLKHGLLLEFKPLNLDVLPLYIVLMALFPPALRAVARWPDVTLAASFCVYLIAQSYGVNLGSYPGGSWYFNPFAWQFLFMIGGWVAVGGASRIMPALLSKISITCAFAFLLFSLAVVLAARFPQMGSILPDWMVNFRNDKTNLAPYRIVHILALALIVVRFIPKNSSALRSPLIQPLIVCGKRSLEVFCVGVFLSFVAHFAIELVSGSIQFQIVVSFAGIIAMTVVAYYRTWTKALRATSSNKSVMA